MEFTAPWKQHIKGAPSAWDPRGQLASKTRASLPNKLCLTRISSSASVPMNECGFFKVANSHLFFSSSLDPSELISSFQEFVRTGAASRLCIRLEN